MKEARAVVVIRTAQQANHLAAAHQARVAAAPEAVAQSKLTAITRTSIAKSSDSSSQKNVQVVLTLYHNSPIVQLSIDFSGQR